MVVWYFLHHYFHAGFLQKLNLRPFWDFFFFFFFQVITTIFSFCIFIWPQKLHTSIHLRHLWQTYRNQNHNARNICLQEAMWSSWKPCCKYISKNKAIKQMDSGRENHNFSLKNQRFLIFLHFIHAILFCSFNRVIYRRQISLGFFFYSIEYEWEGASLRFRRLMETS